MARSGWPPRLVALVRQFVEADSWAAARVLVESEPRLRTEAADGVLADLIEQARSRDDDASRHMFTDHRDVLRGVRADGPQSLDVLIGAGVPAGLRDRWVEAELAYERYRRHGTRRRMDAALHSAGVVVTQPEFAEVAPERRAGMAQAAGRVAVQRFQAGNDGTDLDLAVTMFALAVDSYPAGHPDRAACASALGTVLCLRYELRGDVQDLDAGLSWARDCVADAPNHERWLALHNLAANLGVRYELLGRPDDLQDALAATRDTLAADPPPDEAPQVVNNLCNLFMHRFERDGSLDDLDAAAELAAVGVRAAERDEDRGILLATAASVALLRFTLDGEVGDLDGAASDLRRAIRVLGRGSAYLPLCFASLGSVLLTRWEATGAPADLTSSCDALGRAVAAADPAGPRVALLISLRGLAETRAVVAGSPVRNRFGRTRADPLSAAIEVLQRAVDAAIDTPRLQPFALTNLGTGLAARHRRDGRAADLEAGVTAYRTATSRAATEDPQLALRAAVEWGDWAMGRRGLAEAGAAYRTGIDAVDELRRRQLVRGHKEAWIALGQGLAEKAATAAVRARRPEEAATALERCRAQLLSEKLSVTRLHLLQLDGVASELAARYRAAAERVRGLEALGGRVITQSVGSGHGRAIAGGRT